MESPHQPPSLLSRLGWFVLLWLGGVGTVTIVGYGLRLWLAPSG
jgi:hypothetical protein